MPEAQGSLLLRSMEADPEALLVDWCATAQLAPGSSTLGGRESWLCFGLGCHLGEGPLAEDPPDGEAAAELILVAYEQNVADYSISPRRRRIDPVGLLYRVGYTAALTAHHRARIVIPRGADGSSGIDAGFDPIEAAESAARTIVYGYLVADGILARCARSLGGPDAWAAGSLARTFSGTDRRSGLEERTRLAAFGLGCFLGEGSLRPGHLDHDSARSSICELVGADPDRLPPDTWPRPALTAWLRSTTAAAVSAAHPGASTQEVDNLVETVANGYTMAASLLAGS
jgi:hypothetical protein